MPAFLGENCRKFLGHCGGGVIIHPFCKIVDPEKVAIGDFSVLDDFTIIIGGEGVRIGRMCHVASFTGIIGGGEFLLGDFTTLSAGTKVITGTADFSGIGMVGSPVPPKYKKTIRSGVHVGRNSIIGAQSIILPGVVVEPYAGTGAGTVVTKLIPRGQLHAGNPNRFVRDRDVDKLMELEAALMEEYDFR